MASKILNQQLVYKNGKQILEKAKEEIFALKRAGKSIEYIGKKYKISEIMVNNVLIQYLDKLCKLSTKDANVIRRLECARLDEMLAGVYPEAIKGKGPAVDRALKIIEKRSKLLGLEAPVETKVKQDITFVAPTIKKKPRK